MGLLEPHGRHRDRDGQAHLSEAAAELSPLIDAGVERTIRGGRLLGIARKARPRGAVEELPHAHVGLATGVEGDLRGAIRPGRSGRRQVTVVALADWRAALAELGIDLPWTARRVNLLVDGIDLPREWGVRLRVGTATFEITGECDPCHRMEEAARGLFPALVPSWRGGRLMRVTEEGDIALGDRVTIVTHPLPLVRCAD